MVVCAGIDLAAGRGVTAVAPLRVTTQPATPALVREGWCAVADDDALVALLTSYQPVVAAIDAPLSLPAPVSAALTERRAMPGSPYTRAAERDPLWSRLGVRPLPVSFLGGLTFRALVLRERLRQALPEMVVVETFPSAVHALLDPQRARPTPPRERPRRGSPDDRRAVLRALSDWVRGLPMEGESVPNMDMLDAVGAGLAAIAVWRGVYCAIGDPAEGQIVLPAALPVLRAALGLAGIHRC